jgi:phosphoglycerol transferase MdoB-like AlkP superfamily enzyme
MDSPQAPKQPIELVKHRALAVWLLFVLIASAKVFAVRWLILDSTSVLGALSDVLFVVAVFTVADLFFADMRFRAYMIADVLLTVLLFAIAVYSEYYQLLPTRESLAALGMAGDVKTSISELLTPLYLLFFIDIPLLMLWGARARRRGVDVVTSARNGAPVAPGHRIPYVYQRRFVYVVGAIALVGFLWNVNSIRTISEPVDGNAMSRQRGLTTYLAASAFGSKANAAEHKVEGTVAEIQDQIDGLRGAQTSTTIDGFVRGSAAGSNVIVIQVEAMQGAVIGARVGGVEVTPNLNKLIARSWYYPNHMSQVGRGTTADAEFASTTSAYPPGVGAASLLYVDRELPSMPRTLEATGYDAVTFHTNNAEFWNRTQLYPAIGYGEYYDSKFFKDEDKIGFGSSDKVLFAKALDELQTRDKAGKRFYAQLVTVTSHFPFTQVPVEERDLDVVPPYTGTIEGDYLTEMKYTDAAIGKFLDDLDAAGLLDKSIVVIYGDHFGLPEPRKAAEEDAIRDLLDPKLQRDYP